jgi:hypothetical protein
MRDAFFFSHEYGLGGKERTYSAQGFIYKLKTTQALSDYE